MTFGTKRSAQRASKTSKPLEPTPTPRWTRPFGEALKNKFTSQTGRFSKSVCILLTHGEVAFKASPQAAGKHSTLQKKFLVHPIRSWNQREKTQPHTKLEKPPAFLISKLFKVIAAKNLKMWVRRVNHSKKNTKKELKQNTHQQNLIWEDTRSQCSCKDGVMACGSKSAQAVFEVACWFKPGDQPVQHSQVRQPMWDIV